MEVTHTMSQSNTNIVQARFLADIIVLQQTTAPVALEIGAVINGTVENGVITVSKAPGAILSPQGNVERGQGQERGRFRRALAGVRAEFPYSRRGMGANVRPCKNRRYQRVERLRRSHK